MTVREDNSSEASRAACMVVRTEAGPGFVKYIPGFCPICKQEIRTEEKAESSSYRSILIGEFRGRFERKWVMNLKP